MTQTLSGPGDPTEDELLQWVKDSIKTGSNIFSYGYQGHVYLYQGKGRRLIIKAPTGWGLVRLIHRAMLRNEHRVYSRLAGINGIPSSYGLLDGCYLVLEYIDGLPIRKAEIADRDVFFDKLLALIKELHNAGVAHGDLKKKDNVLVIGGREPCVIDFGVAVVKKSGFALLNRYLYKIAQRFDFNAWVKLKTDAKTRDLIHRDDDYYRRTAIERLARRIKRTYVKLKRAFISQRKKYWYF
ncbi:MAG: hypothetical protein ACE5NW_12775 [Acidiferrobacterales bacterium]